MVGFGRIFSGTLTKGDEMYVIGANHTKKKPDIKKCAINDIFILMGGSSLKVVNHVGAGNIIGIGGLDDILYKMGTLSSVPYCPSFAPTKVLGTDLVKVAIEPTKL